MASKTIYVTGLAMYPKLFERNRDRAKFHEETDGITCVDMILEQDQLEMLKEEGCRLRPKVTEDGIMVRFRRPWVHKAGIEAFGGPPQVVDIDGADWDDGVSIGNGSKVEVALDVYDTSMGKGTRLSGVKVLEHVPYESEESGEPRQKALPF